MTSDDNDERRLEETRRQWDEAAPSFDDAPDHGLRDPAILLAWTDLLRSYLPLNWVNGNAALDIGCGTGSLSVILAGQGYAVTGIDISPEMINRARQKAARLGHPIDFQVMDAANPQFPPLQFDVILSRHLLWALPSPADVLKRWANLLKPGGLLLLVEGFWHTGAGLRVSEVTAALPETLSFLLIQNLSGIPALWGGAVEDQRYAILARKG